MEKLDTGRIRTESSSENRSDRNMSNQNRCDENINDKNRSDKSMSDQNRCDEKKSNKGMSNQNRCDEKNWNANKIDQEKHKSKSSNCNDNRRNLVPCKKSHPAPNNQKQNYQKELEKTLATLEKEGRVPSLLLHACCAPCSSYVMEYLASHFSITILFYNPNISEAAEYEKRKQELLRLIQDMPFLHPVSWLECTYQAEEFYQAVPYRKSDQEGGESCFQCYRLRLEKTAQEAAAGKYDYFTTTLSISPLKNAQKLNAIGRELSEQYQVPYLYSDFKKKNGYKRSIELSAEYGLYRQNYCGCIFSKKEAQLRDNTP